MASQHASHGPVLQTFPNPSVEARPNGRPPWPELRYGVHFLSSGQGVLPLVPPHLKRYACGAAELTASVRLAPGGSPCPTWLRASAAFVARFILRFRARRVLEVSRVNPCLAHAAYRYAQRSSARFRAASAAPHTQAQHLAQAERQRHASRPARRFLLSCAARACCHTVVARLARTLGHAISGVGSPPLQKTNTINAISTPEKCSNETRLHHPLRTRRRRIA